VAGHHGCEGVAEVVHQRQSTCLLFREG
jgi:hypothetical protein